MKSPIMISVVLANFNGASYVEEAIESVLNQKYSKFELIVVDDCSTDKSNEICFKYAERNPRLVTYLRHNVNRGQSAGFNTGYQNTSGEVVCFIDSDDVWKPEKLAKIAQVFNRNPAVSLVQHNMEILNITTRSGQVIRPYLMCGDLLAYWQESGRRPNLVPTSGLAYSRRVLELIFPIPEVIRICSDAYLARAALIHGEVHAIMENLGYYRIHASNNTFENISHKGGVYYTNTVQPELEKYYDRHGKALPSLDKYRSVGDKILDMNLRLLERKASMLLKRIGRQMR